MCVTLQNIVKAGSAILDPRNKEHWDHIQRTEGGTAHLLNHFEDYTNTVVRNMRKTYLKPFIIVTDNMSESCHKHKYNFMIPLYSCNVC